MEFDGLQTRAISTKRSMSSPNATFIQEFEEIVGEANGRARTPLSHSFENVRTFEGNGTVRKTRAPFLDIRDVRNALRHPWLRSEGDAIHISEAFFAEVLALLRLLRKLTQSTFGMSRYALQAG